MRDLPLPFRFDLRKLPESAGRKFKTRLGGVSISLPFVSFSVNPNDLERRVAREIVIRMSDRRVLDSRECCDDCIDKALVSLVEIRAMLVNKQVELSQVPDSAVYLLIEREGATQRADNIVVSLFRPAMRIDNFHEPRVADRKQRLRADCRTPDLLQELAMRDEGDRRKILPRDASFLMRQGGVEDIGTAARTNKNGKKCYAALGSPENPE